MNAIDLAKVYVPLLDEVYKEASITSILDGATDLMREGYNANEICIPMLEMDGLADYSRNSGYAQGNANLTWETVKCEFDRGRKFNVDDLDNAETGGVAFGLLAGEFIRTKVVPEIDAYRFAKYASKDGVGVGTGTISSGTAAIAALRAAMDEMDNAEVPAEDRYLYGTPGFIGLINDMDTTKSRALLGDFAFIGKVPQSRFYTKITQNEDGYDKAADGADINFMIIHKSALIQFSKLVKPKILTPEVNPDGDSWIFGYRNVGIADVYANKLAGVYVHAKAAPVVEDPDEPSGDEPSGS